MDRPEERGSAVGSFLLRGTTETTIFRRARPEWYRMAWTAFVSADVTGGPEDDA